MFFQNLITMILIVVAYNKIKGWLKSLEGKPDKTKVEVEEPEKKQKTLFKENDDRSQELKYLENLYAETKKSAQMNIEKDVNQAMKNLDELKKIEKKIVKLKNEIEKTKKSHAPENKEDVTEKSKRNLGEVIGRQIGYVIKGFKEVVN